MNNCKGYKEKSLFNCYLNALSFKNLIFQKTTFLEFK